MVKISAVKILDEKIDLDEKIFFLLSEENRNKIENYKFKIDILRYIYGKLLARVKIVETLGIKNSNIFFTNNNYGKPILINYDLYFNISHSGKWIVCAISNENIGVDVEEIKDIDLDVAKKFFSKEEYNDLISKVSEEQKKYFYDLWTLKESYIKFIGNGLNIPLKDFSIKIIDDSNIILKNHYDNYNNCYFRKFSLDDNYKLSSCSLSKKVNDKIQVYEDKEIINIATNILTPFVL